MSTNDPDPTPAEIAARLGPLTDQQCARIGHLLSLVRPRDNDDQPDTTVIGRNR